MPTPSMNKLGVVLGILISAGTVGSTFWYSIVWAADQRYVQQEALRKAFNEQRLLELGDRIDHLRLLKELHKATDIDTATLKQLERKREDLLDRMKRN